MAAAAHHLPAGTQLGEVHLAVTDETQALRFWTGVLGLRILPEAPEARAAESAARAIRLGSPASHGRALVVLHPGAAGPVVPRRTGLYHVALHVPTKHDLAVAIGRLFELRYPNSPTDHLVSETTYLNDPDGNGIELTLETPERGEFLPEPIGPMAARTPEGELRSGRDPLDLRALFAELGSGADLNAPLAASRVHHVHLHVADIERAGAFYEELIGFPPGRFVPGFQMLDFSLSATTVVHSLALNAWAGVGTPPPPPGTAGLRWYTLVLPTEAGVDAVQGRLEEQGYPFERLPEGLQVKDPSGNTLRLRSA